MNNEKLNEIELVKGAIMEYVEGVVTFDFEKGMHPWHPDGLKISYNPEEGRLVRETILQSKPNLTQAEIDQVKTRISQQGTLKSIDITGNAAAVKLVWVSNTDTIIREYTDYILLLKIEDEWKIVSKVFHIDEIQVD